MVIRSSRPLLVGQFGGFADTEVTPPGTGPRAMLVVPAAELWRPWYTLATGHSEFDNFTHYVVVVASRAAVTGLTLDARPLSDDTDDSVGSRVLNV